MSNIEVVVNGEATNTVAELPLAETHNLQTVAQLHEFLYDNLQIRLAKIRDDVGAQHANDELELVAA